MKTLLILAAVVATIGCSASQDTRSVASESKWTPAMVQGFTLELEGQPDRLVMSFPRTGEDIGVNYKSGEELAVGMSWTWQIGEGGDLEVIRYSGPRYTREVTNYRLISFSCDRILARSDDRELEFRRYPNQSRTSRRAE